MVPINTDQIPESTQIMVQMIKILSHGIRATILKMLHVKGETAYSDLLKAINIPQSTLSGHIASLSAKGVLKVRISGKYYFYELVDLPHYIVPLIIEVKISNRCQSFVEGENNDFGRNINEFQSGEESINILSQKESALNKKSYSKNKKSSFLLQVGSNDYIYIPPSFEELRANGFVMPISMRPKFKIIPEEE
jgi:DNA-binding transcriptional ArsR family regulator